MTTSYYDRPSFGFGGHTPNILKSGTFLIIAVCVGIFLVQMAVISFVEGGQQFLRANFYISLNECILHGKIWQLFTYALFHGGGWHLFGNMLAIFFFGSMIEGVLGRREYLVFAFYSIIFAGALDVLVDVFTGSPIPSLGISGFCFAVLFLAAILFPHTKVYIWGILPVPLWLLAALMGVITVSGTLRGGDGVAHWAHMGGIIFGFLYYQFFLKRVRRLPFPAFNIVEPVREFAEKREFENQKKVRERVDQLLDKINDVGISGLTEEERTFLRNASKKFPRGGK